jgi:hypothetical protein
LEVCFLVVEVGHECKPFDLRFFLTYEGELNENLKSAKKKKKKKSRTYREFFSKRNPSISEALEDIYSNATGIMLKNYKGVRNLSAIYKV